jgi:hypothetical protein
VVEDISPEHLAMVKKLIFDTVGGDRMREVADAFEDIGRVSRERA